MANESPAAVLVTEDGHIVTGVQKANEQETYVVLRDVSSLEVLTEILRELKTLREKIDLIVDS
jgi:uncharacterized protein YjfI (DUF2170 family)